jgi:hypothetical protein
MKNRLIRRLVGGAVMMLLAGVFAGCATPKPGTGPIGRYAISVSLDDSLKTASVIVDLVGVNPASLPRWEEYPMGDYWKEGDAMRKDADKYPMNFVSGQSLTNTMPKTDPLWAKWASKGVTHVLVLADLPGANFRPGKQDARRLILPLYQSSWEGKPSTLKVLVQRSGIQPLTPMRPVN